MPNSTDGLSRLMAAFPRSEETTGLYSRRRFLTRAGTLTVAATALTALLAACGSAGQGGQGGGSTAAPTAMGTMAMGTMPTSSMSPISPAVSAAGTPQPNQVFIENFAFQPVSLTVPVGAEVTWFNHDDVPHTVTSRDAGLFSSQALDTNDQFSHRFDAAGTYAYYCEIHPIMNGTVIVQ
jgi:plastocyanin